MLLSHNYPQAFNRPRGHIRITWYLKQESITITVQTMYNLHASTTYICCYNHDTFYYTTHLCGSGLSLRSHYIYSMSCIVMYTTFCQLKLQIVFHSRCRRLALRRLLRRGAQPAGHVPRAAGDDGPAHPGGPQPVRALVARAAAAAAARRGHRLQPPGPGCHGAQGGDLQGSDHGGEQNDVRHQSIYHCY